jgi:RES domain-containing protein
VSLHGVRLTTTVYRAHHPRWSWSPESGEGARLYGGRFNRIGRSALYTSLQSKTALLESQQGLPRKAQPITLCAYDVDCDDVLDLTDPAVRDALGIDPELLRTAWALALAEGRTPATWTLAERLIEDGAAGALAPSFAPGTDARDLNVVFWRWSRTRPHRVRVIDDQGRLPRDDSSWR